MEAKLFPSLHSNFTPLLTHSRPLRPQVFFISSPPHPPKLFIPGSSTSNNSNSNSNRNSNSVEDDSAFPAVPPPDTVEIRFRRGARRRSRELQQQGNEGGAANKPPTPTKDWESMTLGEKAVELYVGEKGLLFWLNKLAYASIFIIIGGWILFRFVGPSIGLYQLDSAPLSPSSLFKGG